MEIHSYLLDKEKKLVLIGVKNNIADIFDAIGLNEIVDIYPNLDSFLNK